MSEWWTYSLSDFLMFSPRTYWRLIELYHRAVWPGQLLALGAGVGCLALARRPSAWPRALALGLLATAWLWVGWGFHVQRYATINWAAPAFGAAFAVQSLLLGAAAWRVTSAGAPVPPAHAGRHSVAAGAGWLLAAAAVLLYPLAGWLAGRPLAQSDCFGLTPDPTALATLGLLPASTRGLPRGWCWLLAAIPLLSLALGAATLWTMAGS